MRLNHSFLLAAATMLLLPTGRLLAEDADPETGTPTASQTRVSDVEPQPVYEVAESVEQFAGAEPADNPWLEFEEVPESKAIAARFGWWGVKNTGSLTKTGEWQGLHPSSPFWDVDGIWTNGGKTLDFFVSGPENETTQTGLHFYNGPGLTLNLDYERFIHRLDHQPLAKPEGGFFPNPEGTTVPGYQMWGQDFNVGQDYAMNVQQLKANFKGNLTENIKWRLNVWGMEKEGIRQVNAATHCYNPTPPGGSRCHVVSNAQRIDWLTMEIEPVIEARLTDWMSVEYSRTMRQFQQNDSTVMNRYASNLSFTTPASAVDGQYALVPESYTEIDRLKLAMQLGTDTDAYVIGHVGNTENQYRDINRRFGGVDGRITNRSFDGMELTGYGKVFSQDTTAVPYLLDGKNGHPQQWESSGNPTTLAGRYMPGEPVDRDFGTAGAKGRWRPFYDERGTLRGGLALTGGYEYSQIGRRNTDTYIWALRTAGQDPAVSNYFFPYDTTSNKFYVGAEEKWTDAFTSYLRYTIIATSYPLYGVTPQVASTTDAALNTSLPTHEDRIEIGGTWNLADNFMLNGQFWLERTYNHGPYAQFDEDNYPFMLTAWYAPTARWSVSGGYAQLTNWITQDITLGAQGAAGGSDPPAPTPAAFTTPWNYAGQSDVVTLSSSYATTERLTLTGGLEYVHGRNAITSMASPVNANPSYSDPVYNLANYSRIDIDTWRLSAGVDYLLRRGMSSYFRYNYYDYGDATQAYNTGTTSQFLAGLTGTY